MRACSQNELVRRDAFAAEALVGVASQQHNVRILVVLEQAGDAGVEVRHMRVPLELVVFGSRQGNGAAGWR